MPGASCRMCSVAQFNRLGMALSPELKNAPPYLQKPLSQTTASRHRGWRPLRPQIVGRLLIGGPQYSQSGVLVRRANQSLRSRTKMRASLSVPVAVPAWFPVPVVAIAVVGIVEIRRIVVAVVRGIEVPVSKRHLLKKTVLSVPLLDGILQ